VVCTRHEWRRQSRLEGKSFDGQVFGRLAPHANSLCLEPGGAVYLSGRCISSHPGRNGHRPRCETMTPRFTVTNRSRQNSTGTPPTICKSAWARVRLLGQRFDHGRQPATIPISARLFTGHIDYPAKHHRMKEFWERPSRPCAGTALLTSRHFPEEFQGNFLNCNVISFQGSIA